MKRRASRLPTRLWELEHKLLCPVVSTLLWVGGRTNLQPQYRSLVEKAGGQFIYHDGGKEEALSRLPELLGQADAVICPADCVGHPAYSPLKRHCKQAGKPCVLLRDSGLASFADGLPGWPRAGSISAWKPVSASGGLPGRANPVGTPRFGRRPGSVHPGTG